MNKSIALTALIGLGACIDPDGTDLDTSEVESNVVTITKLTNAYTNQCMSPRFERFNEILTMENCNGTRYDTRMKWKLVPATPDSVYLINVATGLCAEVNNNTNVAGERIDEFYCNGTTAEQFETVPVILPDGRLVTHFRHKGTQLCIDTAGGTNSELMQNTCRNDSGSEGWIF